MHQFFDNKMLRYQHAALVLITLLNNLCKPHFSFPILLNGYITPRYDVIMISAII